jgi:hypothetical protein
MRRWVTKEEAEAIRAGKPMPPKTKIETVEIEAEPEPPRKHYTLPTPEEMEANWKAAESTPSPLQIAQQQQAAAKPKADTQKREAELRRRSQGGTVIPFCDPNYPQSQRQYEAAQAATRIEIVKLEQETREQRLADPNRKPVNACPNCQRGHRDVGGACTGWCQGPPWWND